MILQSRRPKKEICYARIAVLLLFFRILLLLSRNYVKAAKIDAKTPYSCMKYFSCRAGERDFLFLLLRLTIAEI